MLESDGGWADDVAVVLRRRWRVMAAIIGVTMLLPALPLSGLIADAAAMGASFSPHGKGPLGLLVVTVLLTPVLLAVAAGCGLIVARGWTAAVRAAASARSGEPVDWQGALRGTAPRPRLWRSYLTGLVVLSGAAFIAGYLAPGAVAVPDLLVLAGPVGLLAPVLCFALDPAEADASLADTDQHALHTPMIFALAVVVGGEIVVALALSWLLASASPGATGVGLAGINGPAAVVVAILVALPGSVLLAAASSVSYARPTARTRSR
jgi:hypothetical protein